MENISRSILAFAQRYQGILKMGGAVVAFLLTFGTLVNLINISGFMGLSGYPVFSEIMYSFCQVLYILCALAGFCTLGIMLLLKPKHKLVPIALIVLAVGSFLGAAEDTFYYIWQTSNYYSFYFNYPYLFMAFISLLTAVAWAIPAFAGSSQNQAKFKDMALILLIIPAALFLIYFFGAIFTGTLFFRAFLYNILKYALIAAVSLIVLAANEKPAMDSIREMNEVNAEQRWQEAQSTRPGQTAHASYNQQQAHAAQQPHATQQPQRPAAGMEPEGYIGIVKLIILSIVTLGIYVYIWIYKTTRYLDNVLNRQGSFSPGVEVVLCLFVPFYFIYWVYKQTKATEDAHRMRGNLSNSDLAIINLILCIVGFGIVAYALLQDQINKLATGYTEPPSYARPQQTNHAQQQQTSYGYNFDPMTGEPIRKAPAAAPQQKAPAETFTEVPIQQTSADTAETPMETFEEVTPAETFEEVTTDEIPAEVAYEEPAPEEIPVEEVAAEIIPEAEIPMEETPSVDNSPEAVAEQLENVKMLKQLLDAGVLTQEEFDIKKKNILGL
ncbi:MAG: DUF4234 domain-containing protein [Firmicutes bacterium]|nr:DUF4234 domain-containing protein [Bacillota bacterium]